MAKDPAFLFYSNDFDSGTKFFTDEQTGKYIRLMIAQHQHGHLTEQQMLFICKSYDKDVFEKFTKDTDGMYFNERLEVEIEKRKNYTQSRRDNRLNSKKELSYDEDMNNHMIPHMENENENENINENIEIIYNRYPSKCPVKNTPTGKTLKNKEKIKSILKIYSVEKLSSIIDRYVKECTENKVYLKNFSTFLNNIPDYQEAKVIKTPVEKEYQWHHMTDITSGTRVYRGTKDKYERDVRCYGDSIKLITNGN